MSARLKEINVNAIPSYKSLPRLTDLVRESVKQAAVKEGANTILATRVVAQTRKMCFSSQIIHMIFM
jgi:hypothetical protein